MAVALETRRKIVHILEGGIAAALVFYDLQPFLLLGNAIVLVTVVSLLSLRYDIPGTGFLIQEFDRGPDDGVLPAQGTITLLSGILLSTLLFETSVAMAAIVVVTLGDSLNALVGQYVGVVSNPVNPHRNVEGFLMGFVASAVLSTLFISVPAAFMVSAAGMIVEALNLHVGHVSVDDNLSMPLTVGVTYHLIQPIIPTLYTVSPIPP